MAKLEFRYGTMGSAKSADLLINNYNLKSHGLNVLLLTSHLDDRFGKEVVVSRIDGIEKAKAKVVDDDMDIYDFVDGKDLDYILIDEVQFFRPVQIKQLSDLVDKCSVNVIAYGLRSNFKGEPFEGSAQLMAIADELKQIEFMCECGRQAIINARFDGDDNLLLEGQDIQIGDSQYKPLCRKCWKELQKK